MFVTDIRLKQMRDKVILEIGEMLKFIPDYYNNQNMCNKTVDNYVHTLGSIPNVIKPTKCIINL